MRAVIVINWSNKLSAKSQISKCVNFDLSDKTDEQLCQVAAWPSINHNELSFYFLLARQRVTVASYIQWS